MSYPVGPLLGALAQRVLKNLKFVEQSAPEWGTSDQDRAPHSDTQLLMSLLGVLVFPHERTPAALSETLRTYESLDRVVQIQFSRDGGRKLEVAGESGESVVIDPDELVNLPTLLRNCIAHFNVLPIGHGGRFVGIRVWNRNIDDEITFVADIQFDELRPLAHHVLTALSKESGGTNLRDPEDPLVELERRKGVVERKKLKAPRLNEDIWKRLVQAHGGDVKKARTTLDRLIKGEADRLLRGPPVATGQ